MKFSPSCSAAARIGGCLALLGPFGVASAATIVVDDSGGQDYTRIQSAINAASSGDTIQIRAGLYSENLSIVGKSLTLVGAGSSSVEVQADGSAAALAIEGAASLDVSGLQLSSGERGLTVRQSTAVFSDMVVVGNSTAGNGGGIGIFEGAEVSIEDCVISGNEATSVYHGGGVYVDAASLLLERCELSDNEAEQGGALYAEAGVVELVDCSFHDNIARSHGGAARLRDGSSLVASGTTLEGNSSSGRGGAVSIEDSDSTWSSCSFLDNVAATGGGALHLSGQGSSGSSVDGTLDGNTAGGAGGAIWAWDHDLALSGEITDNISPDTEDGGGVYASALALTLSGLTVSGHRAANGGGVYASAGTTVTMTSATFSDNEAVESGGGLYASGVVAGTSSTFTSNQAGSEGAGIYVTGADVQLQATNLQNNAASGAGGGLLVRAGSVNLSGMTVQGNSAAQGGGVCVIGSSDPDAQVAVSYGTFSDNAATSSGGGLYVDSTWTVGIWGGTYSGNDSGGWGGGLYLLDVRAVLLRKMSITDNDALQGGGLYLGSATGTVAWNDLTGNHALGNGGGAVLSAPSGNLTFRNNRVVENDAGEGGGLYLSADAGGTLSVVNVDVVANGGGGISLDSSPASSVINSMLVGNTGVGVASDDAHHSGSLSYNLVYANDTDWGGELSSRTGQDGNISQPPQYRSWADDGDPGTEVLLLGSLSPARDAGDPSLLDLDASRSDMGSYGGPEAEDGDEDGDGWSRSDGDCDDSESGANPGGTELVYDGLDNDCDPSTLDDDLDGDGFGHDSDCDDQDISINPDAEDIEGDGVDQNCDGVDGDAPEDTGQGPDDTGAGDTGVVDENDVDGDGYSPPEDCNDTEPEANPGMAEICDDYFDNDCDGFVDASDGDCLQQRDDCTGCSHRGGAGSSVAWLLGLLGLAAARRRRAVSAG